MADTKSIFDLDEFAPYRDDWDARQFEFNRRESYFDGSIYNSVYLLAGVLPVPLLRPIKGLFLPVARAVNVDAGIIPNRWMLAPRAARFATALKTLLAWSQWQRDGVLFVHYGALYGNSGLRISDLRAEARVIVKPISPRCFMLVGASLYDSTPRLALVVESHRDSDGSEFEYAEVTTPEDIRTFKNGKLFGFGGRPHTYPNALHFVNFVEVQHIANGKAIGDCAFVRAMPLLDSLNEMATGLGGVIAEAVEPQAVVIGSEDTVLERSSGKIWYLPEKDMDAKFLVPNVDIHGAIEFMDRLINQVEKSMPELAFDELTSKNQIATASIELQLLELVLLIQRARPNYDGGLALALRLAGRAAKDMGVSDIAILDSEELAFDEERPVLPFTTTQQAQLSNTQPQEVTSV